jgi:protein-S-isoprenylcysteine O-methyltransferase Ste14
MSPRSADGMGAHLFTIIVPESTIAHPGVKFPPPLLFVVAFLAGWLLHRRWPLPLTGADWSAPRELLGAILMVAALSLIVWSMATFVRHRTAIYPNRPASRVVRDGPYRRTRNPMYVSMTVLYTGLTLVVNSWLPLLFLPVALALLVTLVITREERYLRSAFGEEYAVYCREVGRWL